MGEDSLPEGGGQSAEPHTVCPLEGLRGSQGEQEGMVSSLGKGEGRAFPDVCPALCFVLTSHIFLSWPRPSRHYYCPLFMEEGFPCGSAGKESTCNAGYLGSIPGLARCPGGGHGSPLQYSCLKNLHGQRRLVGYSPWGRKESDMTEQLTRFR